MNQVVENSVVPAKTRSTNSFDAHVGRRLRAARMLAGLSQTRLGQAVGLTFQQIQKYEKGVNRIGASRLQQFSALLNVPPSYFFEGDAEPAAPIVADDIDPSVTGAVSQRQAMELVRNFSRIESKSIRRHIFDLVKAASQEPLPLSAG